MRYLKDLFLTKSFLIKGHVGTGPRRLSTYLNDIDKPFIEVVHPTIINCTDGSQSHSERVLLHMPELLLAVELDDAEGDEILKNLTDHGRTLKAVEIYIGGEHPMEIRGNMDNHTAERIALSGNEFIVVKDPSIHGLPVPVSAEHAFPDTLSYIIVNRNHIELLLI